MKTKKKLIISACCIGATLQLVAALAVAYFVFRLPIFDRGGWKEARNGLVQYCDYFGRPLERWQTIDGQQYYFQPETGEMHTGWLETESGFYYFTEQGTMHTGWLSTETGSFYFDDQGRQRTGWIADKDCRYFLDDSGILQTGWLEQEEGRYYLGQDGAVRTGKQSVDESTYFFDKTGIMQTGWIDMDGQRYYCGQDGVMHTGWLEDGAYRYYFRDSGEMATGPEVVLGERYYFAPGGEQVVLVNRWNPVPDDYAHDLVHVRGLRVDASCSEALEALLTACETAGYACELNSAYRSISFQQRLWDNRYYHYITNGYREETAFELTAQVVAVPGTSEHHLGLAVDIVGSDDMYQWLADHSWEYGFILRYPADKTEATGIIYEPWHFRYVGKKLAEQIFESGLCLEEFLGASGS